ncbi:MAG: hypothetical protein ABH827_05870 [bacterium]
MKKQQLTNKNTPFVLTAFIMCMLCFSHATATLDQQIVQFKNSLNVLKEKLMLLAQKQTEVKAKIGEKAVSLTAAALFEEYKKSTEKNDEPFLEKLRLKWNLLGENEKNTIRNLKGTGELEARNFVKAMNKKIIVAQPIRLPVVPPAPPIRQLTEEEEEKALDAAKVKEIETLLKDKDLKQKCEYLNKHFNTKSTSAQTLLKQLITQNETRINYIIEQLRPKTGASKVTSHKNRTDLTNSQITLEQLNKEFINLKKNTDEKILNYLLNQVLEIYKPKARDDEW